MSSPRFWIAITVGGFPSVAATFFLYLWRFRIYDLESIEPAPHYFPYIAVSLVVLSYVFGYFIHLVFHRLSELKTLRKVLNRINASALRKQNAYNTDSAMIGGSNEYKRKHMSFMYGTLVLYRLLAFGTLSLDLTLSLWLSGSPHKQVLPIVFFSGLLFTLLFVLAYVLHLVDYVQFNNQMSGDAGTSAQ